MAILKLATLYKYSSPIDVSLIVNLGIGFPFGKYKVTRLSLQEITKKR